MRSHFINSSFMFHQDFQTLENNKNTRPSASCFHQLSRVWKPWWNTRPLLWNIASLPCEDSTFRVKAFNYLMFIGVLYHRFRWGISFFIRCKSRSVSTFSLASAKVKARILKAWKLIKGNHIFTHDQSITFLYLQFYCHNDLNNQFTRFGSAQTPVTIMLFGDDLSKSVKEISETNKVGVKVSSKRSGHYHKQQRRSNFSSPAPPKSEAFFMENSGGGEGIFSRPQNEGEIWMPMIVAAKPQDHLNLQGSLDNDNNHANAYSKSFVAGRLKH